MIWSLVISTWSVALFPHKKESCWWTRCRGFDCTLVTTTVGFTSSFVALAWRVGKFGYKVGWFQTLALCTVMWGVLEFKIFCGNICWSFGPRAFHCSWSSQEVGNVQAVIHAMGWLLNEFFVEPEICVSGRCIQGNPRMMGYLVVMAIRNEIYSWWNVHALKRRGLVQRVMVLFPESTISSVNFQGMLWFSIFKWLHGDVQFFNCSLVHEIASISGVIQNL